MRIIHLRASNFYGGPERQLHHHARLAASSSFHVIIASFSEQGTPEFIDVIARDGLSTHVFDVANAYDSRAIGRIKKYLRQENIDLLCTHDYRTHVIGWLATRSIRTRWIAFSRGWTRDNLKVRAYHLLDKIIVRAADHIVAVSHGQKKKLQKIWIPTHKISVAHNAISLDAIDNITPLNLRDRHKFDPKDKIIIAAGRFSAEKGQLHLIRAAAQLAAKYPKLKFLLFGDGPDMFQAKSLIETHNLQQTVFCPGFEKQMIAAIKGADIIVNPSLSEGLPNIVLEAMACRKPVIATAVGGVPELISHGDDGLLIRPGNPTELAVAIEEIIENPDRAAAIAENGRRRVKNDFTFEKQFEVITGIYRQFR